MSTPEQPPAPAPAPAAPAKKSNTLVIVLCVILGVILLIVGSCVATCAYVGKKARDYAKDSQKNPQISALALAAAVYPGVEVVSKDLDAGTIVLKNKKTGETVKLDSRSFTEDRIGDLLDNLAKRSGVASAARPGAATTSPTPADSAGPSVSAAPAAAQATTVKNFPADFPAYTGGGASTIEAAQQSFAGMSSARQVFTTSDAPGEVADFFDKKLTAAGYAMTGSENGSDDHGPTVTRLYQKNGANGTFNLTARVEDGKTHVEANLVLIK